jgi:hypothetical protein
LPKQPGRCFVQKGAVPFPVRPSHLEQCCRAPDSSDCGPGPFQMQAVDSSKEGVVPSLGSSDGNQARFIDPPSGFVRAIERKERVRSILRPYDSGLARAVDCRRLKTGTTFYRPTNRVVHVHVDSIMPKHADPDALVFLGRGTRQNRRFRTLCGLADIVPKKNVETGQEQPCVLEDLRRACATYCDQHVPESSVAIPSHSAEGVTYRH